jgi:hypothetical protein
LAGLRVFCFYELELKQKIILIISYKASKLLPSIIIGAVPSAVNTKDFGVNRTLYCGNIN